MSKSFYVNGIEMKSTADGDNFDIDINKTTTTTLFPSGTDTKIKDETGNVAPNILGTNSHISLDKTDSCSDSSTTMPLPVLARSRSAESMAEVADMPEVGSMSAIAVLRGSLAL